MKIRAEIHN